jgi:DNA-binding Lrp family transcriptional regulator
MAKFEVDNINKNLAYLTLEKHTRLELSEYEFNGYVRWGKSNDYPKFLLELYEQDADHAAIVNSKAAYLWGKGLKAVNSEQEQAAKLFLEKANPKETWSQLGKKISKDLEFIDGVFLNVITDLLGNPLYYYHLPIAGCRLNKESDILYFSNDWDNLYLNPVSEYRLYQKGLKGSFFMYFKYYKPTKNKISGLYPEPNYKACLKDICADTEIGNFNYNFIANGFSAGTIVTFYNGEPTAEVRAKIREKVEDKHTGTDNAGSTVINYVDKDGKAAEVTAINVNDLDKKFEVSAKRALQKKLTGHRVTNPQLFGIRQEGTVFSAKSELRDSFELFLNNYTKPRQEELAEFISELCFLKTGQRIKFEFEQNDPVGLDLYNDQDLTQDERRELKGYKPLTATKVDANGVEVPLEQVSGNDILNTLSRKQVTNLLKVVDDYGKGRTTKPQAMILLKSFGLNDAEATEFLGDIKQPQQFSAHKKHDTILMQLEASAEDENTEDEILFEEEVNFKSSTEALKFEMSKQKMYFADALNISITDLKAGILNVLKGNPTQTPASIAKALGISVERVNSGIDGLLKSNLIDKNANAYDPTEKAFDKETSPLQISTVYTVYKYALKSDAPALVGGSSRPFCSNLMKLSSNGKTWTFEAIDKMNNDLGLNVWDFRGGYYNNPSTGEIEPYCRHIWKAITKIKRSK